MNYRRLLPCLAVILGLGRPGWTQTDRDVISVKGSPRSLSGQITATSPDEITLTTDGSHSNIAVDEIEQIRLFDDPPGLRGVRDAIRSGQYERALQQVEGLETPPGTRDVVRQDVEFHRALATSRLATQGTGDLLDAARLMKAFLDGNPSSLHYYPANEMLGDLAMALGKHELAAGFYEKLAQAKSGQWRAQSQLLQARALQMSGDFAGAAQRYQQLVDSTTGGDAQANRLRALAQVGLAGCQAEIGQYDAGIKSVQEVIGSNDPQETELFARAYNALGSCHRKANQPQDAVLAYLHVHLLFFREFDAHAEALYYLSQLWPDVGKPEEAVKTRKLLQERYAASAWSTK